MLRDDHSGYQWFFPFATTAAENAANEIIDWCAAFGVPQGLMSDGPTHFRNETMLLIAKGLRVPHHFTLPYTPWRYGTVERLGKELVRALRATVSEFQMRYEEWPDLLPLVQSALNNAPSTARDNIRALQDRMDELHPLVQKALQSHRDNSRRAASKGRLPNFTEGDFVLVAQDSYKAGEKLALRWRGPRRVIQARSEFVYQVEDLRNGALEDIHATRLKFYRDSSLNTEAIMLHVLSSESGMVVSRLMRLVESEDGLHVVVRWKGLPHSEDSMEPLGRIYEDVPQMVLRLTNRKSTARDLTDKARAALSL